MLSSKLFAAFASICRTASRDSASASSDLNLLNRECCRFIVKIFICDSLFSREFPIDQFKTDSQCRAILQCKCLGTSKFRFGGVDRTRCHQN